MTERRSDAEVREQEQQGPVIRDKRRIDPNTGAVREPAGSPAPAPPAGDAGGGARGGQGEQADQVKTLEAQLAERTADLQRVQAEYANYRKRVERDRVAVRELALAGVLTELLPVLDDIGRAREHGELQGGFRQVAESLESILTKLGLVRFGEKGEPFDPTVHEALMHSYSSEATETTCVEILQPGYSVGGRVLRPARVAVAEPTEPFPAEEKRAGQAETGESRAEAGESRVDAGDEDETDRGETGPETAQG